MHAFLYQILYFEVVLHGPCERRSEELQDKLCDLLLKNLITWFHFFFRFVRSSCPKMFCKNGFLKNFANIQANTCARASFLIKLQAWGLQFCWKRDCYKVFSCEFCEVFKNTFFKNISGACFWINIVTVFLYRNQRRVIIVNGF